MDRRLQASSGARTARHHLPACLPSPPPRLPACPKQAPSAVFRTPPFSCSGASRARGSARTFQLLTLPRLSCVCPTCRGVGIGVRKLKLGA